MGYGGHCLVDGVVFFVRPSARSKVVGQNSLGLAHEVTQRRAHEAEHCSVSRLDQAGAQASDQNQIGADDQERENGRGVILHRLFALARAVAIGRIRGRQGRDVVVIDFDQIDLLLANDLLSA